MDLQTNNNKGPIALRLSQSELCRQITAGKFEEASRLLPTNIQQALDCPTVNDLVHAIGKSGVALAVEFELCKMADLINVGGNLTGAQTQFIAAQLVEMFPAENLADFKICFQRGAMGRYGEIYRMDGIVIRKWMEAYLEEKYKVLEDKLMKEKYKPYQIPTPSTGTEGYEEFKKWAAELKNPVGKTIRPMSDKEIKAEGRERETAKGYPITDASYHEQRARESAAFKEQWLKEMRAKYPGLSDEQLNTMV